MNGSITRDLLIGAAAPAAAASWHSFVIAVLNGLLTFLAHLVVQSLRRGRVFFDAIGLAVFAVAGAEKALQYGIDLVMASRCA